LATPSPQPPHDPPPDVSGARAAHLSRLWPAPRPVSRAGAAEGGAAPGWHEADLAAILRHQLDAPLAELEPASAAGDTVLAGTTSPVQTVADLLTHDAPAPDLLLRVKDWAKEGMNKSESEHFPVPREVAGVLYFTAIAASLVSTRVRISSLPSSDIAHGASWALGKAWLDGRLHDILREALGRTGTSDSGGM
jgi:hypothetical protein